MRDIRQLPQETRKRPSTRTFLCFVRGLRIHLIYSYCHYHYHYYYYYYYYYYYCFYYIFERTVSTMALTVPPSPRSKRRNGTRQIQRSYLCPVAPSMGSRAHRSHTTLGLRTPTRLRGSHATKKTPPTSEEKHEEAYGERLLSLQKSACPPPQTSYHLADSAPASPLPLPILADPSRR